MTALPVVGRRHALFGVWFPETKSFDQLTRQGIELMQDHDSWSGATQAVPTLDL
jgi:hypothetical protein